MSNPTDTNQAIVEWHEIEKSEVYNSGCVDTAKHILALFDNQIPEQLKQWLRLEIEDRGKMLYQVDTGAGLMGVKYIKADSEDEAIEKAKDMLFNEVTTSNCCGIESNDWNEFNGVREGFCPDCKEHCVFEANDEANE